ncbi:FAD:protein FMN transferase [Paraclostridium sordellii]|uniref:FAD:protein FMN transferase n=1 Tax=Paraclostridium sordellii TaxID=1505 RepID=UPI0005E1BE0D|nr:FAD:protein FMN transferase [Paeniclostridium sordellii]CEO27442.1 thiamine biosynthesis lipoprotein [[Clostridium] sordellii] [Paeniclostridium sordellii]
MLKKRIIALGIVFIFFLGIGYWWIKNKPENIESDSKHYEMSEKILGTIVSGVGYGENSKQALEKAFKRANDIENIMSVNIKDSELSKVNEKAFYKDIKLSDDLYYVIEKSLYYAKLTNGAFDPTIGNLIDAWGIGTNNGKIPEKSITDKYKNLENYKNIRLNKETKEIRFLDKNVKLDLGAIGKGYIGDEMKKVLNEEGIKSALINLGGNVVSIGYKPGGEKWNIGIVNPKEENEIVGSLKTSDEVVVTSGNYERYFIKNGVKYHHILDPKTAYPSESGLISTTIVTKNGIDADALSTATYILGVEKAKKLIESLNEVEAFLIKDNMDSVQTQGLNNKEFRMR